MFGRASDSHIALQKLFLKDIPKEHPKHYLKNRRNDEIKKIIKTTLRPELPMLKHLLNLIVVRNVFQDLDIQFLHF